MNKPTPNIIFASGGRTDALRRDCQDRRFWPITTGEGRFQAHDSQLALIGRRNALAREAEQMLAVVKRFKDLCQAGVIVSKTTQAECDRIIAAVEGGAS